MLNIIPFENFEKIKLKKIAWLTDLHLDAAESKIVQQLLLKLNDLEPDLILIGGDTCNGQKALDYISLIAEITEKEVYFVLGNHEFYRESITHLRQLAHQISQNQIRYLTKESVIPLNDTTALIGHDGWADARAGDFQHSTITLHDYSLIKELKNLSKTKLQMKLHQLGSEAAHQIQEKLESALQQYSNIVLLTHAPPFQVSSLYDKHISDDNWVPHFICKAMGDILHQIMLKHPHQRLVIFCGHAHHLADVAILPNLRMIVGKSTLGSPHIQGLISI